MQTLASYIRGNAPKTNKSARPSREMPTDIQAALNVLAWRGRHFKAGEDQPLELYGTDLRGMVVKSFKRADGDESREGGHFEGAQLYSADLEDANLTGINLKEAILRDANLKNAVLALADLTGTDLTDADLQGVDLGQAQGLTADQLKLAKNWEKIKTVPWYLRKELVPNSK
jgi:uncharacterized protein YjbI with pentapeptide repeats